MNILLIQPRRIGDVLLTTPVLAYLRKVLPTAKLHFLLEKSVVPLLKNNPHLDHVVLYDPKKSWAEMRRIRAMKFDAVLDFMANPRTSYISFASGARWRASWSRYPRSLFYNVRPSEAPAEYSPLKKIRLTDAFLARIGVTPKAPTQLRPQVFLSEDERQFARAWMADQGLRPKQFFLMAPAFRHRERSWSLEGYRTVALRLAERLGKKPFLFWGPNEESVMSEVRRGAEERILLLPPTSMREMAAIFEHASFLLTNDSGAMHTAVAVNTPTATFYGPTKPVDWNPSLAGHGPRDVPLDMKTVTVDQVVQVCEKLSKENG
jgi:ADP-heptose:LPS heptosyltransferase